MWNISLIAGLPYELCPQSCSCTNSRVNCSNQNFKFVPHDLPPWTETLIINNNPLDSLTVESFHQILSPYNLSFIDFSQTQLRTVDFNFFLELFTDIHFIDDSLKTLLLDHNYLTTFPLFRNISNLRTLSLANNNLRCESDIDISLLYPMLETLDLSGNSIKHLSKHFLNSASKTPSDRLKILILNNNGIESIDNEALLMFPNLKVLKLSKNNIAELSKDWLSSLVQLKELDLNFNQIDQINILAFNELKSLQVLKMRRNKLHYLSDGSFWGLANLQRLHLDHNNITDIRLGWTFGLESLKELTIRHNSIREIQNDSWNSASNLVELHLNYNLLTAINRTTFSKLTSLQSIKLSNNLITFIEDDAFRSLTNLEQLDLSNNQLSWTIEGSNGFFNTLRMLKKLRLDNNQIRHIFKHTFNGLNNLMLLNLTGNPITSIQNESFLMFRSLKELDLEETDLLCDCTLKWLVEWLYSSDIKRRFAKKIRCKHPVDLHLKTKRSFLDAGKESFQCKNFLKPYLMDDFNISQPIKAIKHKNITFHCKVATSSNEVHFNWFKNNQIIDHPRAKFQTLTKVYSENVTHHTNVFTLINVEDDDHGKYHCKASNDHGSVYSHKFEVNVYIVPYFTKRPVNITVEVGHSARLECAANGQPAPNISWSKDDGDNFPAAMERRMRVMPLDDVFFIVDVKEKDMGWYTCNATNDAKLIQSSAYLNVIKLPSFTRKMTNKKSSIGNTVQLECLVTAIPKPKITWFKDGVPLEAQNRHFLTTEGQGLFIVKLRNSDQGTYSCNVSNAYGTVSDSLYLEVISNYNTNKQHGDNVSKKADDVYNSLILFMRKNLGIILIIFLCVFCTSIAWIIVIWRIRCTEKLTIKNIEQNEEVCYKSDQDNLSSVFGSNEFSNGTTTLKTTDNESDSSSTKVCFESICLHLFLIGFLLF